MLRRLATPSPLGVGSGGRGWGWSWPRRRHAPRRGTAATAGSAPTATPTTASATVGASRRAYDVAIIGGGIVGAATARAVLATHPHLRVALLDKEPALAAHQSSHNSGVVHAGIYYPPGSLKARLCVEGAAAAAAYAARRGIPYKRIGKLIVALTDDEVPALEALHRNATTNGVGGLVWLPDANAIRRVEPAAKGVAALHSTTTAITDWAAMARAYGTDVAAAGGDVLVGHEVTAIDDDVAAGGLRLTATVAAAAAARDGGGGDGGFGGGCGGGGGATTRTIATAGVITCAGAWADTVAGLYGGAPSPRILPVRGEYLRLAPAARRLVRGLIYPVPRPGVPFLGVHFTPTVAGEVLVGPNAVLAGARDGYSWRRIDARHVAGLVADPAFWRLTARVGAYGVGEAVRSVVHAAAVADAARYVDGLTTATVLRGGGGGHAGVRAQALDKAGGLVEDFVFEGVARRALHVRNAPSPGATSALAIARVVAARAAEEMCW